MRWNDKRLVGVASAALMLGGCGMFGGGSRPDGREAQAPAVDPSIPTDDVVKIGEPYTIAGQRFEPRDDITFDEVGYASWYGDDKAGMPTANGETYRPDAISAAHRLLPMPSYAEVTNLETGKTILVRINDRGPFAKDRVIDLSAGAARLLGLEGRGVAPVRVRRVNPPFAERTVLRAGGAAPERLDTPPALLSALRRRLTETNPVKPKDVVPVTASTVRQPAAVKPKAAVRPVPKPTPKAVPAPTSREPVGADFDADNATPVAAASTGNDRFVVEDGKRRAVAAPPSPITPRAAPAATSKASGGTLYVQFGAFSKEASARALAAKVGGKVALAGNVWRVRTGPFNSEASARDALSQAVRKGYRDARITF